MGKCYSRRSQIPKLLRKHLQGGHLEFHAALWPVLRHKPEPEQNLDLNLTVHKMRPMGGLAGGTEVEVMGLLCPSGLQPSVGQVEIMPGSPPLPFVPGGPRRTDHHHLLQVCSLCKAQWEELFSDPPMASQGLQLWSGVIGLLSRTPQADPCPPTLITPVHMFPGQKLSIVDSSLLVSRQFYKFLNS